MITTTVPGQGTRQLHRILDKVHEIYAGLESNVKVTRNAHFKDLVCPKNWKDHAFDRWFKLKEGYSSQMVYELLREFRAKPSDWVLDPFLGSGSTLVGARKAGVNGIGFEVNPFLLTLARTKVQDYKDIRAVETRVKEVVRVAREGDKQPGIDPPKLSITAKLFREQLPAILSVKETIMQVPEPEIKDFLLIGLGCILERVSYAKKDGNGLKYPKNKVPMEFAPLLEEQYRMMVEDIEPLSFVKEEQFKHVIVHHDSRDENIMDLLARTDDPLVADMLENARFSIFSPPYCNCFDYTEVYKIELWMLDFIKDYPELKILRARSLSSHLNKRYNPGDAVSPATPELEEIVALVPWEKTWGKDKMKAMVLSYFEDMDRVFNNIDCLFQEKGTMVCVVGNSAYGNVPIATDLILANMLIDMGYDDVEVRVARSLTTSSQQQKVLGNNPYLRESLVIASK